jgi:hypothetical protein
MKESSYGGSFILVYIWLTSSETPSHVASISDSDNGCLTSSRFKAVLQNMAS